MAEEATGQETGNQGGEGNFIDTLPEDLREEASLRDFKDVGSLAKSYVHAQKLVGHDKLPVPTSPDDDVAWNEVYNRLGRPSSAEEYDLKLPDPEVDGYGIKEEDVAGFKETAHGLGLNAAQAQGMINYYQERINNELAEGAIAQEKQYKASVKELRKEFGATYDAKVAMANRAMEHFGGEEVVATIDKLGLANNPNMVRMFVKIAEHIGEDKFGEAASGLSGMTPAEARGKIATLKMDQKFMSVYTDRYANGHGEAVAQMQELFKYAYPS